MAIKRLRANWAPFLLVAFAAARSTWAQFGLPVPVDPKSYFSPLGKWRLDVDPSTIYGAGGASYVVKNAGKTAWQGSKPFTLLAAEVTDGGVVAGYSYSGGTLEGHGSKIHLIILDAHGDLVLDATEDRRDTRVIHGDPEPWVNGILLDAETDRVTFRVEDSDVGERWETFCLSNGKAVSTHTLRRPDTPEKGYVWLHDVRAVRGTPLNLVAWGIEEDTNDGARPDTRFALLDSRGKTFWQFDPPRRRIRRDSPEIPPILPHNALREFEILSALTGERVRFRVNGGAESGFRVSEIRRDPYDMEDKTTPPPPNIETPSEARVLPSITLGRDGEGDDLNPVRGVTQFDIDSKGRFGFARRDAACTVTFVLLDGDATQERVLGSLEATHKECYTPLVAWAGGSTWLVTQEYAMGGSQPIGWWVDVDTRVLRRFTVSEALMPLAVAGTRQGAVVLIGANSDFATTLLWIDSNNRENRSFREAVDASHLSFSPKDVAVTRTGDVAVIDVIRRFIDVFDRSGSHKQSIDLEATWGRDPRYPSGLSTAADGGFFVDDFGAERPLVRIDGDGSIRAEFSPRYEDGNATGRIYSVRVAPDGKVWGSDGEALLQLDERGVVVSSIGPSADVERLGEIAAWTIGQDEKTYAVDRRSGAVHVFDSKGLKVRTCAPGTGQIADALDDPSLSVSIDGRILLHAGDSFDETASFLEFSPNCSLTTRDVAARSMFWSPSPVGLWIRRFQELALLDLQGRETLRIDRRPDRRWLNVIHTVVLASNGSLAVASDGRKNDGDDGRSEDWALSTFGPGGQARTTAFFQPSVDSATFAFDGRRIVAWDGERLRITDVAGAKLALLSVPKELQAVKKLPILLRQNGREAWILDGERRIVHRVQLP